jgi:hypothetical protein
MVFHGSAYFFLFFDTNLSLRNADFGKVRFNYLKTHTKKE